ncbi:Fibroblast growth factor receptor-like protein 1 [Harpegnathos saltator]|uniref:Fibroblast growth factor receptor-like protein 1 n=1 Tax=Harpegnathos saltator TaxID=610380 RepID=E2C700_HARSA|nr:Fibroblast growth factor receptor-like protein 1 [Harpegnathos saltator]
MRVTKHMLKFKYVDAADAGVYACRLKSPEKIEWRNITVRIESPQNDSFQDGDDEETSVAMDTLRPEEETNDLEIETRNLPETRSLRLESDKINAELDNEKAENDTVGEQNNTVPESPPAFNKSDEMHASVVKPAGNMLRLRCPSVGNPKPNITWLKNNEEPRRDLGTVIRTKWTLRLEDLVPKDSGNYTCIVCNYLGCIKHTFKVEIMVQQRTDIYIANCHSGSCHDRLLYQAHHKCDFLLAERISGKSCRSRDERNPRRENHKISRCKTIALREYADSCHEANKTKQLTRNTVERFPHKPYINEDFPKNVTALVNSTAIFRCPIVSDLEPFIEWKKLYEYPRDEEHRPEGTSLKVQQAVLMLVKGLGSS